MANTHRMMPDAVSGSVDKPAAIAPAAVAENSDLNRYNHQADYRPCSAVLMAPDCGEVIQFAVLR
jgi:hypothetical protein